MQNSSIFFPCWGNVKNPQFIACDDTQNHCRITCMLSQKFLSSIDSCLFILIGHVFSYTPLCNPQRQEHVVWSCGKLQYYVHLSTNPKFSKSWTFSHIWELWAPHVPFHQSKHCSVDHFFHRCECFPNSCKICVLTSVGAFRHHVYTVHIL